MRINHQLAGNIECPDPDEIHRKLRESYRVTRPRSLASRIETKTVYSIGRESTETFELVLEFKQSERADVVRMLRDAADGIEALNR
jgi:hypothetical protein